VDEVRLGYRNLFQFSEVISDLETTRSYALKTDQYRWIDGRKFLEEP